jgi:redox-sensitive bicupin YhaK (pirin superfamily)
MRIPEQELIAMPAITVDDTLVLPRIPVPDTAVSRPRPVARVVTAHRQTEGAGFSVRRPFPGELSMAEADPFLLLDHLGPQVNRPDEARGAPWHPHRGFETVSYILDGEIAHHDTNGGGGVIGEGDTQWMTAGGGILHDELPTERMYRSGGPAHAVQLWVNLPPALKMTPPRYQSITRDDLRLLTSADGGALIRLIAGEVGGFTGPGATHTPITYAHVTLAPSAQLAVPWNQAFSAMAYVLTGRGSVGNEGRPVEDGQLIVFGPGDHLVVVAADRTVEPLDVLLLGGLPIQAPIAHYGPFVMNSRAEIIQAVEDYEAGRLGIVPADQLAPRNFA